MLELEAARAIAYAAEVAGMDPEPAAALYLDLTPQQAKAAVKIAQQRFGLSTESEWAGDFLYAHRHHLQHPSDPGYLR